MSLYVFLMVKNPYGNEKNNKLQSYQNYFVDMKKYILFLLEKVRVK